MKIIKLLTAVFAATLLVGAGCGKSEKQPEAADVNGVRVDYPKLQQTFANSTPEVQATVSQVGHGLRYGDYTKALMSLDELANNASVTEPQKKVVAEVIEQVKKVAGTQAPPPAQQ